MQPDPIPASVIDARYTTIKRKRVFTITLSTRGETHQYILSATHARALIQAMNGIAADEATILPMPPRVFEPGK